VKIKQHDGRCDATDSKRVPAVFRNFEVVRQYRPSE
jgi:hypothetical protein